ncbi:MAG TPA: YbdD/YjiX family protein [Gemmatimonadales bacterium]|nr:YbdD/YjiX family protein [Gemmatimonadales bacterium]
MPTETVLNRFVRAVRRILGMPDYEEYLRHLKRCHASDPVPSEREFFESYLRSRYGRSPSRCC